MQRIILIKPVSHVQIGHLYEHLYCAQLANAFRSKGLFSYIDYDLDGKTFYDGYIRIDLKLYSAQAIEYYSALSLDLDVSDDAIAGALLQIMAEKYADIHTIDYDHIRSVIQEYEQMAWMPKEDVTVESFRSIRKNHKGLLLADRAERHFIQLRQTISLDTTGLSIDASIARPLFVVLSDMLRANLQEDIANTLFCYSTDDYVVERKRQLDDINIFRIDKRQATTLSTEIKTTSRLVRALRNTKALERVEAFLQGADVQEHFSMPDDIEVSNKVELYVGAAGWRKIGTLENLQAVFDALVITMKLTSTTESVAIKDIR